MSAPGLMDRKRAQHRARLGYRLMIYEAIGRITSAAGAGEPVDSPVLALYYLARPVLEDSPGWAERWEEACDELDRADQDPRDAGHQEARLYQFGAIVEALYDVDLLKIPSLLTADLSDVFPTSYGDDEADGDEFDDDEELVAEATKIQGG